MADVRVVAVLTGIVVLQAGLLLGRPDLVLALLCLFSAGAALAAVLTRLPAAAIGLSAAVSLLSAAGVWLAVSRPAAAATIIGVFPILGFACLTAVFAVTLRAGAVPMISRFIQADVGPLTERLEHHGRRLTVMWTALLFATLVQLAAAVLLAPGSVWPGAVLAANTAVMVLFFLWQHRQARHYRPGGAPASAWNTLRVMTSPDFWRLR